jgi:hypothetical protein
LSGPEPVTTLSRREAVAADSAPAHVVGRRVGDRGVGPAGQVDAQTNGVGFHASTSTSLDAADPRSAGGEGHRLQVGGFNPGSGGQTSMNCSTETSTHSTARYQTSRGVPPNLTEPRNWAARTRIEWREQRRPQGHSPRC